MKKIPTLFKRIFEGGRLVKVIPEVSPGLEYIVDGGGTPTVKLDGACCAVIKGRFYKRYDAKKGKPIPENAIKCQGKPDPITGHWPCWVPVDETNPADKWFMAAYNDVANTKNGELLFDWTYEAVGKHFNNNPYGFDSDTLLPHGFLIINDLKSHSFQDIREWLEANPDTEGIVFWDDGKPICKIKRSDFGLPWNVKTRSK